MLTPEGQKAAAKKFLLLSDSLRLDELKKDAAGIAEAANGTDG